MCYRILRMKEGPGSLLVVAIGCLISVVLSQPLDAASPNTKGRRTAAVQQTAAPVTQDEAPADGAASEGELTTIDVLKGQQTGQLSATAEGTGDGRMTLSLTNRTNTRLRVVLPPGLIASGVTGQFGGGMGMMGGMGGMGGGMMGGMGGGMMGGMGGGMMGGMGGMGGGMGGMGGMGRMGGGMMGSGTLPASMGMMMLGKLIMSLIGDRDNWDQRSLMSGMMMGMGGMGGGMGGMGGGMGGMEVACVPFRPPDCTRPRSSRIRSGTCPRPSSA